jgi:hypothetical protein
MIPDLADELAHLTLKKLKSMTLLVSQDITRRAFLYQQGAISSRYQQ